MQAAGLTALVLGTAAGGGFPQWNCACRLCRLVRDGDPRVRAATQASVAFSADGKHWVLVGASPDLRQQIIDNKTLHPFGEGRHSPITGVVLVSADVDGIAGLLVLRECQPFRLFAPPGYLNVLRANPMFGVLDPSFVEQVPVAADQPVDCGHGLRMTLLPMPGKVPLYMEDRAADRAEPGPTYAAMLQGGGRTAVVAPACADITSAVRARLAAADLVFFDGTVFRDDEMTLAGVGSKTGRRMGHVPMSGPDGSIARLAGITARRVFLHINNTNPVWLADSPERREVERAGFEIARDGMEIRL
jgi:pyrroloquinoline quinone biosynthesis protein B